MKNKIIRYCLILSLCLAAAVSCTRRSGYIIIQGYAQGGLYSIKLNMDNVSLTPENIKSDVDSILEAIDVSLSGYNHSSYLSRWNAGERDGTNDLFDDILEKSRAYYEKTGGAVNVAAAPLFDLWGFGFTADSLPDAGEITRAMEACDIYYPTELNFNAVAQGYSCDLVAGYLHSIGVKDMLVDIGEIYCEGVNPAGRNWTLGVDAPVDGNETPGADIKAFLQSDGRPHGIVTSGNYRKFYYASGRKYSHTIDPRTGYPVTHNLLSATVIAPNAVDADAYATYCMVIGLDDSREFILSNPDLEACLVYDEDGEMKVWSSPGVSVTSPK